MPLFATYLATSPEGGQVIHEHPRKADMLGLSLLVMLSSALGAGGREFESLHPDTTNPHIVKDMGFFVFMIYITNPK